MSPARISLAVLCLAAGVACAANTQPRTGFPSSRAGEGIELELAVAEPEAFQRVLRSFVQFGLPIIEASEAGGTVRTGPYQFNSEMIATYGGYVTSSGRTTRIVLRGSFTAAALGLKDEAIREAQYGFRAKLWRHLSQLARAIETEPLVTVVPQAEVKVKPPN